MNSREFFHELFGSINIIYDGKGNVYCGGDQIVKKLEFSKDFILETVPYEFIITSEDVKKFSSDTIVLKEPGIHILLASSKNPLAKDFSIWLFSEVFPRIRGNSYQSVFY